MDNISPPVGTPLRQEGARLIQTEVHGGKDAIGNRPTNAEEEEVPGIDGASTTDTPMASAPGSRLNTSNAQRRYPSTNGITEPPQEMYSSSQVPQQMMYGALAARQQIYVDPQPPHQMYVGPIVPPQMIPIGPQALQQMLIESPVRQHVVQGVLQASLEQAATVESSNSPAVSPSQEAPQAAPWRGVLVKSPDSPTVALSQEEAPQAAPQQEISVDSPDSPVVAPSQGEPQAEVPKQIYVDPQAPQQIYVDPQPPHQMYVVSPVRQHKVLRVPQASPKQVKTVESSNSPPISPSQEAPQASPQQVVSVEPPDTPAVALSQEATPRAAPQQEIAVDSPDSPAVAPSQGEPQAEVSKQKTSVDTAMTVVPAADAPTVALSQPSSPNPQKIVTASDSPVAAVAPKKASKAMAEQDVVASSGTDSHAVTFSWKTSKSKAAKVGPRPQVSSSDNSPGEVETVSWSTKTAPVVGGGALAPAGLLQPGSSGWTRSEQLQSGTAGDMDEVGVLWPRMTWEEWYNSAGKRVWVHSTTGKLSYTDPYF